MSVGINSNINEYNKTVLAVGETNQVVDTNSTASKNCIFDKETVPENEINEKISTEIDNILSDICKKYEKYGLTIADLKKNPAIQLACRMQEDDIKQISEEKRKKVVENFKKALEAAINDSIVNGKIDIKQVAKLSNNYFTALSTGWSIEGFKKANSDKSTRHSLMQRLIATGCLPKGATIQNTSPEELGKAIEKFFGDVLGKSVNQKFSSPEQAKKAQLQTFGRLLINSSEEEKAYFTQALKHLYKENKLDGLKALFHSCTTEKTVQAVATKIVDPKNDITTTADPNGEYLNKDEATAIYTLANSKLTEENSVKTHETSNVYRQQWFEQNGEALKAINAKIEKAKAEGVEVELTEAEQKLLLEYNNKINAGEAGEFVGTHINANLSEAFKDEHLKRLNKDAYELPNYTDVLNTVNEYVQNNPEVFSEEAKADFAKAMDKATNGNYTTVVENTGAELNVPATEKAGSTEIVNTKSETEYKEAQVRQQALLNQIKANSEQKDTKFTVEKSVNEEEKTNAKDEKVSANEVYDLKNKAFRSAENITTYLKETGESKFGFATEVFKKFSDMGSTTQDWAMNYFSNASTTVQNLFLNKITGSFSGMVAAAKEVDLSKFNLVGVSVTTQKEIDKIQDERNMA